MGSITEISNNSEWFIGSFFVIAKNYGGYRGIVNLKPLNLFIRYEHFKMEGLETVKSLIRKGDWIGKIERMLTVPCLFIVNTKNFCIFQGYE